MSTESGRKWRKENPERSREATRNWLRNNREYKNFLLRSWRKRNAEHVSAQAKVHRKKIMPKILELNQRYRSRKKGCATEDCSAKNYLLLLERFCRWCCAILTATNRSIDHIIPLSRGGEHKPDNLAAACRSCNSGRRNKLISEWEWQMAAS